MSRDPRSGEDPSRRHGIPLCPSSTTIRSEEHDTFHCALTAGHAGAHEGGGCMWTDGDTTLHEEEEHGTRKEAADREGNTAQASGSEGAATRPEGTATARGRGASAQARGRGLAASEARAAGDEASGSVSRETAEATPCRRCSECRGENHHWLEACNPPAPDGDGFVGFECKHCDARAEQCDACDGALEPGHECDTDEERAASIESAVEAKLWLFEWIGSIVPQETINEMAEELACIIEDSPCATCDESRRESAQAKPEATVRAEAIAACRKIVHDYALEGDPIEGPYQIPVDEVCGELDERMRLLGEKPDPADGGDAHSLLELGESSDGSNRLDRRASRDPLRDAAVVRGGGGDPGNGGSNHAAPGAESDDSRRSSQQGAGGGVARPYDPRDVGASDEDAERTANLVLRICDEDNEAFVQIVLQLIEDVRRDERERRSGDSSCEGEKP